LTGPAASLIFRLSMSLNLTRMSAAGNVFYLALDQDLPEAEASTLARRLSAGRDLAPLNGAAAARPSDGLILGTSGPTAPRQRMYNPDGSVGHCANGLRCLAALLESESPGALDAGQILTDDGPVTVTFVADEIEACLGVLRPLPGFPSPDRLCSIALGGETIEGYLGYVGNAQLVLFGGPSLQARCRELGPRLQEHPLFPDGVNVEFVNMDPRGWSVRVWERGVGETLSCGTGAVAVAAVGPTGLRPGASRRLHYPGGDLKVHMDDERRLFLTGPVMEEGRYRHRPEAR
jgi:diaminopimelate epimerase